MQTTTHERQCSGNLEFEIEFKKQDVVCQCYQSFMELLSECFSFAAHFHAIYDWWELIVGISPQRILPPN
jgi:hypothetical protein